MKLSNLESALLSAFHEKSGVIGVCGLPGSGKSTLVNRLSDIFGERALAINLDDFCIAETPVRKAVLHDALETGDRARLRYLAKPNDPKDNPYANPVTWYDWHAAAETLQKLKQGQAVNRKGAWNQKTGLCDKDMAYESPKAAHPLFLVDCVYLFEAPLRQEIDTFILIEETPEVSHHRETSRDAHRNDPIYAEYKKYVTELYCVPYLAARRQEMHFVVS